MEILQDFSGAALVRAIEANEHERFVYYSRVPGGELHVEPELTWFITGLPYLLFNGVLQARLPRERLDTRIAQARAPFEERGLPMFWMTGPSSQPEELGEHLVASGFVSPGDLTGMAVAIEAIREDAPMPPGLAVERVDEVGALSRWVKVYSASFGTGREVAQLFFEVFAGLGAAPHLPLCHFLGLLDGKPVATASLVIGAGVAGLYSIGTVPEMRGRGIGTAMTLHALQEARRLGYAVGVLHAEPEAVGLYRRLGFADYCSLHPYVWART